MAEEQNVENKEGVHTTEDDKNTDLYTFFCEFQGGTYISQVKSNDLIDAKKTWAINFERIEFINLEGCLQKGFMEEVEDQEITCLADVKNVWCFTILCGGNFGLINIVKTSQ